MIFSRKGFNVGVVMACVGLMPSVAGAREATGLFQSLRGFWVGTGRVVDNQNKTEAIRCRVTYAVNADMTALNQTLTCASASYKFDVAGSLVNRNGMISGQWQEKTRGVSGQVTGTLSGNSMTTNVSGPGFTAQLNTVIRGNTQSVVIRPQGADVSEISITLKH